MTRTETTARETARETLRHGTERLEEGFGRAQEAFEEGIDRASETFDEADSWLRERVTKQPLVALGLAAAAGYLLGRLFTRAH